MPLTPKLTMHDLHNTDMKKLVRILHTTPSEPISSLPSRLRSTPLHLTSPLTPTGTVKPGRLCPTHSTLNAHLITSIWSWLHYELTSGIGPFLHPVILHGGLTSTQERKARQLEPVAEMWDAHFDIADSTPTVRDPIRAQIWLDGEKKWVSKWRYETTQCPACMLARIGSDNDVLFALFAGTVGRFPERKSGESGKAVSSKRLRFVRYWVKAGAVDGDKVVEEAWEFGREMRRVRRAWREFVKGGREKGRGFYGKGGGCGKDVGGKDGCGCERDDWDEYLDPKVGPLPRPSGMEQRTRSDEVMGRDMSDPYAFRTYEEYMRRRDPEFEHEKHHIDPFADPTTPITPHSEYQSHPQHDQNPFSPPTSPTSPSPSLHGPYPNPEYHAHAEIVSPSHPSIHSHSGKMSTASSDTYEIDSYYYGSRGSNPRVDLSAEKKGNDNEARPRVSKQTQLPRHQHPASVKDSSDAEDGRKVSVGALVASLREEGKCGGSGRGVSVDTRWTDLY